jgi:hypothetical protein
MKSASLVSAAISLVIQFTIGIAASQAAEMPAHHFGKWPAINAIVHDGEQKNLDLGASDFLIEIWFKPLEKLKYKGNSPSSLICKKGFMRLAGYDLTYWPGGDVALTLCDDRHELAEDLGYGAHAVVKDNDWNYVAVSYRRDAGRLALYGNGIVARQFTGVKLGKISNHDDFSVGWNEYMPNSQAHCMIREARIWKLSKAAPQDLAGIVAWHNQHPEAVSEDLTAAAEYSRWSFDSGNEDIKDRGTNHNTLCYAPWGYKQGPAVLPFPKHAQGRTYYVDNRRLDASAGDGSKENPFATIAQAAKEAFPGDAIHVAAGVYRESVMLRAGENGKPITLEGEPGTVVTGADPIFTGWKQVELSRWVKNWDGRGYAGPIDPKEDDARAHPANLLFVDNEPMEFVLTKAELVPGSWTIEPLEHSGRKTLTLCPLPGVVPGKVPMEISEVRPLLMTTKFNHIKGIHFTRGGVSVRGRGNIFENNVVDWSAGNGVGVGGQDNVVRNNKILWAGHTGMGGIGGRITIENNLISYCSWRRFRGSWHGGATKFIPCALDYVIRGNEVCYSYFCALYFDSDNNGNIIDGNICHDNSGAGLFDEFSYGNAWQNNICYNNAQSGFCVGNSDQDTVYRNIFFNNGGGIFFRTDCIGKTNPPEVRKALAEEFMGKLDVRRYQGMNTYQREKKWRDMQDKYMWHYVGAENLQNVIRENVLIDHAALVGQALTYDGKRPVAPEVENTFAGNYYWSTKSDKVIQNGSRGLVDLATWQKLSGQDKGSRCIDPWASRNEMPEWFRQRFHFAADEFRPVGDVWQKYIVGKVRRSIAQVVLAGRLIRSKFIEERRFTDPDVQGIHFELEGKPCISLWAKRSGVKYFNVGGVSQALVENKFLQRKPLATEGGYVGLLLNEDPITLIDVGQELSEDRSLAVDVPRWTEPGKPVVATFRLENSGSESQSYRLALGVAGGWTLSPAEIRANLGAGEKKEVQVQIAPPPEAKPGLFQLTIAGALGERRINQSKMFGIGAVQAMKYAGHVRIDGDVSTWGPPTGIAASKEQVVVGADNWKGPADLSAKVWLRWTADRELFFAADVTDDQLVTNHRGDNPTQSDSVVLCVDARASWKQFMKDYTLGAFRIIMVPGEGESPATARFEGQPLGEIVKVASKRTPRGYSITLQVHFRSNLVEEPGWVANRDIRAGVLVNDSDDPAAGRKTTLGLWRTAADALHDCSSLTTFILEP